MIEFNQAQNLIQKIITTLPKLSKENVSLSDSLGRILSADLYAAIDFPLSNNSAMDGYAVFYETLSKEICIQDHCYAGDSLVKLIPGKAIRLFTGSLLPEGADTIIVQENVFEKNNYIEVCDLSKVKVGQNIRKRGEDIKKTDLLISKGTKLDSSHIALLASQGMIKIPVYSKLKVGIITTGEELIEPGLPLLKQQVYNSNKVMLTALSNVLNLNVVNTRHCSDDEYQLSKSFEELKKNCDLIFSIGGASVGDHDFVKKTIKSLGGKFEFSKVNMKPGKPIALAKIQSTPILCLPGNPVSAYVTFILFGIPLVRGMQGFSKIFPPIRKYKLRTKKIRKSSKDDFLRVRFHSSDDQQLELSCYSKQDSGFISSIVWANGFARIPANTLISDSNLVDYYDLKDWLI